MNQRSTERVSEANKSDKLIGLEPTGRRSRTLIGGEPPTALEVMELIMHRLKYSDVLTELKYQLATQPLDVDDTLPKTKHSILYESIEDLTTHACRGGSQHLWCALTEWYEYHCYYKIVDMNTLNRIDGVIKDSSPFIVYGENLTYQDLIAFKSFIECEEDWGLQ
jgi:hypothetical protein